MRGNRRLSAPLLQKMPLNGCLTLKLEGPPVGFSKSP